MFNHLLPMMKLLSFYLFVVGRSLLSSLLHRCSSFSFPSTTAAGITSDVWRPPGRTGPITGLQTKFCAWAVCFVAKIDFYRIWGTKAMTLYFGSALYLTALLFKMPLHSHIGCNPKSDLKNIVSFNHEFNIGSTVVSNSGKAPPGTNNP